VDKIRAQKFRVCVDTINGLFAKDIMCIYLILGAGSVYIPELLKHLGVEIVGSLNAGFYFILFLEKKKKKKNKQM
jgi:hypothetical protein